MKGKIKRFREKRLNKLRSCGDFYGNINIFTCHICKSNNFEVYYLHSNNSYGAYCSSCGTHHTFLNKEELKKVKKVVKIV